MLRKSNNYLSILAEPQLSLAVERRLLGAVEMLERGSLLGVRVVLVKDHLLAVQVDVVVRVF